MKYIAILLCVNLALACGKVISKDGVLKGKYERVCVKGKK